MSVASLVRSMAAAGATPEVIALAVEAVEAAEAKQVEAEEVRRAAQRERTRKCRDKARSRNVTVTLQDVTVTSPSHDPLPLIDPLPLTSNVEVNLNPYPKEKDPLGSKKKGVSLPKPQKRKTAFPDGFEPSETDIRIAAENGIQAGPMLARVVDHFRDHHTAKGNAFIDWHAALRTWLRSPLMDQRPGMNGHRRPPPRSAMV